MAKGRQGHSGCPRAGQVPGLRKRGSHRHLPTPKNRNRQTCCGSLSQGMCPAPGTPRATPWPGAAEQAPNNRAETGQTHCLSRCQALKGCPVLAPWAKAGASARLPGNRPRSGANPAPGGMSRVSEPRCQGAGGSHCWLRWLGHGELPPTSTIDGATQPAVRAAGWGSGGAQPRWGAHPGSGHRRSLGHACAPACNLGPCWWCPAGWVPTLRLWLWVQAGFSCPRSREKTWAEESPAPAPTPAHTLAGHGGLHPPLATGSLSPRCQQRQPPARSWHPVPSPNRDGGSAGGAWGWSPPQHPSPVSPRVPPLAEPCRSPWLPAIRSRELQRGGDWHDAAPTPSGARGRRGRRHLGATSRGGHKVGHPPAGSALARCRAGSRPCLRPPTPPPWGPPPGPGHGGVTCPQRHRVGGTDPKLSLGTPKGKVPSPSCTHCPALSGGERSCSGGEQGPVRGGGGEQTDLPRGLPGRGVTPRVRGAGAGEVPVGHRPVRGPQTGAGWGGADVGPVPGWGGWHAQPPSPEHPQGAESGVCVCVCPALSWGVRGAPPPRSRTGGSDTRCRPPRGAASRPSPADIRIEPQEIGRAHV